MKRIHLLASLSVSLVGPAIASAQVVIPPPTPAYQGKIEMRATDSTPWFPPQPAAPSNAPNVLLILIDDAGFGATSTFGGPIPTPAFDRLADRGLRYTHFHTTALCSPSRAALITGRNHHSVHTGVVAEQATGFPGYDTLMGQGNGVRSILLTIESAVASGGGGPLCARQRLQGAYDSREREDRPSLALVHAPSSSGLIRLVCSRRSRVVGERRRISGGSPSRQCAPAPPKSVCGSAFRAAV